MSEIRTFSKFFYGHIVTSNNRAIDFSEGGPELQANIAIGNYTLTEYALAVRSALEDVGSLTYTVAVDRVNRTLTISASGTFSLLTFTGSRQGIAAWGLLGYSTDSDKTGGTSYLAENPSGFEYRPQAILYDYVAAEDFQVKESAVKNVSARGLVQTVFFGDGARVELTIRFATDKTFDNTCGPGDVETQANGVQNLRDFMAALINAERIEFMPDRDTPTNFVKMIIENIAEASRQGTSYKLPRDEFVGFYTSGALTFRVVE